MAQFKAIYPGIRKIGYIPCSQLPLNMTLKSIAQMSVTLASIPITWFTTHGEPTCVATNSYKNGAREEKVTLGFKTLDDVPINLPIAIVCESVSGEKYIIGTYERPYPVITVSNNKGTTSESAEKTVEVTHKAMKTLLEVVF